MISAEDFLNFAFNMPRNSETDDRVCIGRAYYAAMHKALAYAVKDGFKYDPKDASGTHSNLIFYFERTREENGIKIADMLKKLKYSRERADYRLGESVFSHHAGKSLEQAKTVFSLIP